MTDNGMDRLRRPAIYVKPFVKGQKNDYNDAEAIAEAALRPNLRLVQEKTQDQLDLQACPRCLGCRTNYMPSSLGPPNKADVLNEWQAPGRPSA